MIFNVLTRAKYCCREVLLWASTTSLFSHLLQLHPEISFSLPELSGVPTLRIRILRDIGFCGPRTLTPQACITRVSVSASTVPESESRTVHCSGAPHVCISHLCVGSYYAQTNSLYLNIMATLSSKLISARLGCGEDGRDGVFRTGKAGNPRELMVLK